MSKAKTPPQGFLKEELFLEWGVSNREGERILTQAVNDGLMVARWEQVTDRTGRPNRKPFYFAVRQGTTGASECKSSGTSRNGI